MIQLLPLVLSGLTTRLGSEERTAAELSAAYSGGRDDPTASTGITALFRFREGEDLVEASAACVHEALRRAGLSPSDVGGLIASSNFTHKTLVPTFGPTVAKKAGLANIRAMTIGTGCGGLAQAVECAAGLMTSSLVRWDPNKVCVIVAADAHARHLNTEDVKTRYLFSEGIAVCILEFKNPEKGDLIIERVTSRSLTIDEPLEALLLPNRAFGEEAFFRMETRPVARFTREVFGIAKEMLGITSWDGITIIPHQANTRLLAAMAQEVPGAHLFYTDGISTIGNTLNASTLFALEDVLERNLASDRIVLITFGAEWLVGGIELRRHS